MSTSTVIESPVVVPSQQDLFGPYDYCEAPQTEAVVFSCGDSRFRVSHKQFTRRGLGLGSVDEQYIQFPIPGGAALFAHVDQLAAYYDVILDCLETYCTHFEKVTRLILLGHYGCKHMAKIYQRLRIDTEGFDPIRRDLEKVVRAYNERSETSKCVVSRLFAMFRVSVEVYYVYPSARQQGKVDVERIRAGK